MGAVRPPARSSRPSLAAAPGEAGAATNKAIWGPAEVDGRSQFPIYHDLGVRIYQAKLDWSQIAPTRPAHPKNPADPAYQWPARARLRHEGGEALRDPRGAQVIFSPPWANGGRPSAVGAETARVTREFTAAAAKRYRSVRLWMVWGEPSRQHNFMPLPVPDGRPGPRIYSRILDAAYGALKRVRRSNLVIGGNTFTSGRRPAPQVHQVDAPAEREAAADGPLRPQPVHDWRRPSLEEPYVGYGFADYSDLDTLAGWVDHYLGRGRERPIRLFISEFTVPTDHPNAMFNFWVTAPHAGQLAVRRASDRQALAADPHASAGSASTTSRRTARGEPGNETNWGLLDWRATASRPTGRSNAARLSQTRSQSRSPIRLTCTRLGDS